MKSEKGSVVTVVVVGITVFMIAGIFIMIFISIKRDVEYGTKEGQVVDKRYQAAYTTMHYSNTISIPQYHPESYQIKIQKEVNSKTKSIWISVDKDTYHNIKIGDYYGKEEWYKWKYRK